MLNALRSSITAGALWLLFWLPLWLLWLQLPFLALLLLAALFVTLLAFGTAPVTVFVGSTSALSNGVK